MTTSRVNNSSINTPLMTPLSSPKTEGEKAPEASAAAAAQAAANAAANMPPPSPAHRGVNAANVQISSGAKDRAEAYQKALDIARATPDVREDRVAELKKQIAEGTYKVDSGNIADGMMREAIKEHLANNDR